MHFNEKVRVCHGRGVQARPSLRRRRTSRMRPAFFGPCFRRAACSQRLRRRAVASGCDIIVNGRQARASRSPWCGARPTRIAVLQLYSPRQATMPVGSGLGMHVLQSRSGGSGTSTPGASGTSDASVVSGSWSTSPAEADESVESLESEESVGFVAVPPPLGEHATRAAVVSRRKRSHRFIAVSPRTLAQGSVTRPKTEGTPSWSPID